MSKRFAEYTDAELIGINNETLNIAIRVEAIQRGIKPPITISEALRQFEEFFEDDTEFQKVVDECLERHSQVRQAAYNAKVRSEKRAEYLRLAGGDETIARAFWAKTEGTEFPTE